MIILIKNKKALLPTAVILVILVVFSVMWYLIFSYILVKESSVNVETNIEGVSSLQPYDYLNTLMNSKLKCEKSLYPLYFAHFYCHDYTIRNYINSINNMNILAICSYELDAGSYNLFNSFLKEGIKDRICESKKNMFEISDEGISVNLNDKKADYVYQFDFITINNKYLRTKIIIKNDD